MAVSKLYTLSAIDVNTVGAGDVLIDQISRQSINTGLQEMLIAADGGVDPRYVAVGQQAPTISFDTSAIATYLGKVGISGLAVSADVDELGVRAYFQQMAEGGTRKTGSDHLMFTLKEGLIIPRQISAPHEGSPATVSTDIVATYDGTNLPIVIANSQANITGQDVDEAFLAGKVMINGSELEGVQNISIDFGIQEVVKGGSGDPYPTYVAIAGRRPQITISTTDLTAFSTFGLGGTAQGATDSIVYLRKVAEDGLRVADNVAEHISFTIDQGLIYVTDGDASQDGEATANVVIRPTYDGTNAILVVSAATAIA